jgi:hypothetical protein
LKVAEIIVIFMDEVRQGTGFDEFTFPEVYKYRQYQIGPHIRN